MGKSSRVIFQLAMFQLPEGDQSAGCNMFFCKVLSKQEDVESLHHRIATKFPRADLVFDTKPFKVAGDFTIPGTSF